MSRKNTINDVIDSNFKDDTLVRDYFKRVVRIFGEDKFIFTKSNSPIFLAKTIESFYGIIKPSFCRHFDRQISGSGNEIKKISSINSSSRLALLCFSGISDDACLKLTIEGKEYNFKKCYFEVKNKVVRMPSNIDVLLVSEDMKVLVYLESKFTEYIYAAKNHHDKWDENEILKEGYFKLKAFPKLKSSLKGFIKANSDNKSFGINLDREFTYEYKEGVKQMISHFIGVCRGTDKRDLDYDDIQKLWENAKKIYLGTILYKFEGSEFFTDYSEIYKSLAECLNNNPDKDKRVKVIDEVLTYQDVFANNENLLTEQTKKFYELGSYSRNS
jgi:hypothetical protein